MLWLTLLYHLAFLNERQNVSFLRLRAWYALLRISVYSRQVISLLLTRASLHVEFASNYAWIVLADYSAALVALCELVSVCTHFEWLSSRLYLNLWLVCWVGGLMTRGVFDSVG